MAAAALNAWSSVIQRQATGLPDKERLFSKHFVKEVTTHKLFIQGFLAQILAAAFQGMALYFGPLTIVEPLLAVTIVFLMIFIRVKFQFKFNLSNWIAGFFIVSGLALAFISAAPRGGSTQYNGNLWIITAIITALIIISFSIVTRFSNQAKLRATVSAVAASSSYAFNAGLAKLLLNQIKISPFLNIFTNWPIYAFILSGILSIILMQNMYASGPLIVSQPIVEIAEPTMGIALGLLIFGEHINTSFAAFLGISLGLIAVIAGIIKLSKINQLPITDSSTTKV